MAEFDQPGSERLRPPEGMWRRRGASFAHAGRGVWTALRSEVHMRYHAGATVLVLALGLYCGISRLEWALVALAVGSVWTAEMLNTALEALTDLVSPGFHPLAGKAKDIAAGAVLVMSIGAAAVGVLVFGPYLFGG